jgi:hypothetical protein
VDERLSEVQRPLSKTSAHAPRASAGAGAWLRTPLRSFVIGSSNLISTEAERQRERRSVTGDLSLVSFRVASSSVQSAHYENQAHWPLAGRAASDLWRKRASRSSKLSLCRPLRPFRHVIAEVVICEILSVDVFPLRDFLRTDFCRTRERTDLHLRDSTRLPRHFEIAITPALVP